MKDSPIFLRLFRFVMFQLERLMLLSNNSSFFSCCWFIFCSLNISFTFCSFILLRFIFRVCTVYCFIFIKFPWLSTILPFSSILKSTAFNYSFSFSFSIILYYFLSSSFSNNSSLSYSFISNNFLFLYYLYNILLSFSFFFSCSSFFYNFSLYFCKSVIF